MFRNWTWRDAAVLLGAILLAAGLGAIIGVVTQIVLA